MKWSIINIYIGGLSEDCYRNGMFGGNRSYIYGC